MARSESMATTNTVLRILDIVINLNYSLVNRGVLIGLEIYKIPAHSLIITNMEIFISSDLKAHQNSLTV